MREFWCTEIYKIKKYFIEFAKTQSETNKIT